MDRSKQTENLGIAELINQKGRFSVTCTIAPNPHIQVSVIRDDSQGDPKSFTATIPNFEGAALASVALHFVRQDLSNVPERFVVTMTLTKEGSWDIDFCNHSEAEKKNYKKVMATNFTLGECTLESFTVNRQHPNERNENINRPAAPVGRR